MLLNPFAVIDLRLKVELTHLFCCITVVIKMNRIAQISSSLELYLVLIMVYCYGLS